MDQLVRNAAPSGLSKQRALRKRGRFSPISNRTHPTSITFTLTLLALIISFCSLRENLFIYASDDAVQGDDGAASANNDAAAGDDGNSAANDDQSSSSSSSNSYENEQKQYQNADDDTFHWNSNIGFDGVSVMPLSCIN
jgi:hypothetical protein